MRENGLGVCPGRHGCWWTFLVILIMLAGLAVPMIRRQLWVKHELADIDRLAEEARRFGGDASVPEGGVDFSGRKIDVFLDLARSDVDDEEFARLTGMPGFKNLLILDLSDTRITDKTLELLEKTSAPILLNVSRTQITDKGMESIAKLPWLGKLMLSGTAVTDHGMDALVERAGSMNLGSMDLTDTKVTADGVKKISEAFNSVYIKHPAAVHPMSNKQ